MVNTSMKCQYCASIFNLYNDYLKHLHCNHSTESVFYCTVISCSYKSNNVSNLRKHDFRNHHTIFFNNLHKAKSKSFFKDSRTLPSTSTNTINDNSVDRDIRNNDDNEIDDINLDKNSNFNSENCLIILK